MSYTTMLTVMKSGAMRHKHEYRNSHLSAPIIWTQLYDKYVPHGPYAYMFSDEESKKLWALAKDSRLAEHEKIALVLTFDNLVLKKKYFASVVDALRKIETDCVAAMKKKHGEGTIDSTHLTAIANDLEALQKDKTVQGVAFIWTSVCGDCWDSPRQDHESTRHTPYNIKKDKEHWFMFEG